MSIAVVGGGIGALAASALLARSGHAVTLLEAADEVGGKSRRIGLEGQRIDTGPSLVTFPAVWERYLDRWESTGPAPEVPAHEVAALTLIRMPQVGRYLFDGADCPLPVPEGHPWHPAWARFARVHGALADDLASVVSADPLARSTLPALNRLLRVYGRTLTTRSYLDSLEWLPDGLREVIAIHTLNAGVAPDRTAALYASMPAAMAETGVWVPEGGVHEIVLALRRLAVAAGVDVRTGEEVLRIDRGRVVTARGPHAADLVVSGLDEDRLGPLLGRRPPRRRLLSCSAVAVHGVLAEPLPEGVGPHTVVLPTRPAALHRSLEAGDEPADTMAFVSHYRPGEVYPNDRGTVAVLLTAPADGREYSLEHPFVRRELDRISGELRLPRPIDRYFSAHRVLGPREYGTGGEPHGALYGAVRPVWRSGPFHRPGYSDVRRPWLWRVGASVHPGGGIPAVLGGALIAVERMLRRHPGIAVTRSR